ncbi:MAG: SpoVG family protein [bacterium]
MEVTSVKINPVNTEGNPLAWAIVIFDEQFLVRNIRLVETNSGVILAMPNEEFRGKLRDIAHPITEECRAMITDAVIEAYNQAVPEEKRIEE